MLTAAHGANKPEAPQLLQKTGLVVNLDEQTVLSYVVLSRLLMKPALTSARG